MVVQSILGQDNPRYDYDTVAVLSPQQASLVDDSNVFRVPNIGK
jgi:hypothetical protein